MSAIGGIERAGRNHKGDIGQMRATVIGIIQDGDVAFFKRQLIQNRPTDIGMEPRSTGISSPMAITFPCLSKIALE